MQVEWLKADLERVGKKKPVAISIHIPLLSAQQIMEVLERGQLSNTSIVTNARSVIKILEQYNVKLVLQGCNWGVRGSAPKEKQVQKTGTPQFY